MSKISHYICSLIKLSVLAVSLTFIAAAQAQTEKPQERVISGGVVNGKARILPAPAYPPSARQAGIGGTVEVTVLIDETGRVVSAEASGGVENAALREVAKAAALKAEFSPTTLEGKPVKVRGTITYNFVLPAETNEEKLKYMGLATIFTVAKSFDNDLEKLKATFEGEELIQDLIGQFPEYSVELRVLNELERIEPADRKATIDRAIAAVESKADPKAKWQIATGKELGGLIGPVMLLMASGEPPEAMMRLDPSVFQGHLSRLAALIAKAPSDIPEDVVRGLAELAALHDRESLFSPANLKELGEKLIAVGDIMSPEKN